MRAPLRWLGEYVDIAPGTTGRDVAASFVSVGLEEEDLHGGDITGPLVVGRVLSLDEQVQKNGKPIRFCVVDVGPHGQMATEGMHQEIVCGATNFEVGDLVVVVLPGAVLPGGFDIAARKTYGRVSNGMICAEDEIGIGDDHSGIIVLERLLGAEALRRRCTRRRRHRPARPRRRGRRGQRHPRPRLLLLPARARPGVLARAGLARGHLPRPARSWPHRWPPTAGMPSGSPTTRRSTDATAATVSSRGSCGASTPRGRRRGGCSAGSPRWGCARSRWPST